MLQRFPDLQGGTIDQRVDRDTPDVSLLLDRLRNDFLRLVPANRLGTQAQIPVGDQQCGDDGESADGAGDGAQLRAGLHGDSIEPAGRLVEVDTVTK